jgi:hypothetical protein
MATPAERSVKISVARASAHPGRFPNVASAFRPWHDGVDQAGTAMRFDPAANELLEQHRKARQVEREWIRKVEQFQRDHPTDSGSDDYVALLEQSIAASRRADALWEQIKPFRIED